MTEQIYAQEMARKENLMDLFQALEDKERKSFQHSKRDRKARYARIFKDWVTVTKVNESHLHLLRENGQVIRSLVINPQIKAHIQLGDHLLLTIGFRDGDWRLIFLEAIGSEILNQQVDTLH